MSANYRLKRLDLEHTEPVELRDSLVLGSGPDASLRIEAEGVAPRHALLRLQDGVPILSDLGTESGTFLGDEDVEEAELRSGDVISLGPGGPRFELLEWQIADTTLHPAEDPEQHTVRFSAEATIAPAAPPLSAEATIPPGTLLPIGLPSAKPKPKPRPGGKVDRLRVRFLSGSRAGSELELAGSVLRVGRAPGADLWTPEDRIVSTQHAKLVRVEGSYVLFDLESRNGTFLNGERIDRAPLKHGDVVELGAGGPRFEVEFLTSGLAARGDATVLIPDFARLAARSRGTALVIEAALPSEGLLVGRGIEAGLRLDSPIVSRAHARFEPLPDGRTRVTDLGSGNGTFVRGQAVSSTELAAGERAVVGPFEIEVLPRQLRVYDTRSRLRLDLRHASLSIGNRRLLHDISLSIPPGSFTALIGPSGAGKSTLLQALAGLRLLESGEVLANGESLSTARGALVGSVGLVPQDDIVHLDLTVAESLEYLARLRLPSDTGSEERAKRVATVLATLELTEKRDVVVRRLSGGQRKRVSIAAELLTEPALLLLDEATSGLDPALEESLMLLLRELSFKGKTVVLVTHTLDNLRLCDQVALLADGRLAFFGTPDAARESFGVEHLTELYSRLKERPAEAWARDQAASAPAEPQATGLAGPTPKLAPRPPRARAASAPRQLAVLVSRYTRILFRDSRNLSLLLMQAPLIALLIGVSLLYGESDFAYTKPKNTILFLLSLTSVWFGCSNAARELVKERSIFRRERLFGLGIVPYVLSKLVVLAAVAAIQCSLFLLILNGWFGIPGSISALFQSMLLACLCGLLLGLALSAISATPDRAMTLLPILLIPQVLFTSPAIHMDVKGPSGMVARGMPSFWAFDLLRRVALAPTDAMPDEAVVTALEKGGPVLMTKARFEHLVSDGYDVFRYRRAMEMTWTASWPESLAHALPVKDPTDGGPATVDALALLIFCLVFFSAAATALRKEDRHA